MYAKCDKCEFKTYNKPLVDLIHAMVKKGSVNCPRPKCPGHLFIIGESDRFKAEYRLILTMKSFMDWTDQEAKELAESIMRNSNDYVVGRFFEFEVKSWPQHPNGDYAEFEEKEDK